jgi:ribonuclease HI
MSEPVLLTIHTDGASRGNPGDAAFAYVIAGDGLATIEEAGCLGRITNNQAEYTALVRALEHALRLGTQNRLLIHSDSELMVKQMRGEYKVKNEDLRDLYDQARKLVRQFAGPVTFKHVRREYNKRADELCNEALDGLREPSGVLEVEIKPAAPPSSSLRDEALACLREAAVQPDAQAVWQKLLGIFEKHGVSVPR